MFIGEAKSLLESIGYIVERKNSIIRYHITERKYLESTLRYGLDPMIGHTGRNTADHGKMKPGIWLSGSMDYIPVLKTVPDDEKVLLKITMPADFYLSHEREYWPEGRTMPSVTAKPGEPAMNSREGRVYVEKFNGAIPPEYISVEPYIGKNRRGDKRTAEYYRYIADELMGDDFDSDNLTDKQIETFLRNMPITKRKTAYYIDGIDLTSWKPGQLPELSKKFR